MPNLKICYNKVVNTKVSGKIGRSVSYKGKTWDLDKPIYIGFINGTAHEKQVIKNVYSELTKFIGLEFIFINDLERTDIRWSFNKGQGSWSYVGTDATFIPKNLATANIGWEIEPGVARHEVGHSLGLAHEHQNPKNSIKWDREQVIADLSGAPNYWSVQDIERNVLNALDPAIVNATDYDEDSVMLYFFPDRWTLDGKGTKINNSFSETDIAHLKEIYPEKIEPTDPTGGETGTEEEEVVVEELLKEVFSNIFQEKTRLKRLTEDQLIRIANYIGIDGVAKEDLKIDTISKIWSKIST